ncbi:MULTISPECIES: hypothetical protein [unclassified Moorena]|uniref:hypothetical protein n=1 Tax=unclassified Moorena TaxID=2683338 RepID=UPI0013B77758|nr:MULTISPECIES: hypothetical protein [unclassified Moorena]NEQ04776.1 hypothetical protein [Moorena sp. SIO4E2]NER86739.1 hypothetical protein [Moorena sp. SIO3A2]NES41403.1 hypothetical protein [Moorena sp. SIO2C4]NET63978.1 hypothetical protein [Moorena sp. SIO1G6]
MSPTEAVVGQKRCSAAIGEQVRSWGGSAVLGRQRGLGGFPHERLPWSPRRRNLRQARLYGW